MNEYLQDPKYRKDIDGLRAVAILSVVGFHAAPGRMPGGFIGVDIFFVISGFLISSIIFKGLEASNLSLFEFYSRRIKRIYPALLTVLFATFVIGWFSLLSEEYKQLGMHIAGGAGFVSNFVLWNESGYFDNVANTKLLLHLWSLAIEEQFYIFWPLLLAFVWKKKWSFIAIALTASVISFVINIYFITKDPAASFYLPASRFWELMIGGLLAYIVIYKPQLNSRYKNAQSIFGMVLLALGFAFVNQSRSFPGWWALLPTFGTFFIISAGSKTWINKYFLSNKLLVWVGLISYPLYLWHWPLLSFLRIMHSGEVPQLERFYAILTSFILAWLTYKLIEKPIRYNNHSEIKTKFLFALMIIFGCIGYTTYLEDGFKLRTSQPKVMNKGDIGHNEFFAHLRKKYNLCTPIEIQQDAGSWNGYVRCYQSKRNVPKQVAIIGDSHAEHLYPGIADALEGENVVLYGKGGLPILSNKEFEKIFSYIISDNHITTIILSANWSEKINAASKIYIGIELSKTVDMLIKKNKVVYIIDDVPNFLFEPNKCKYVGRWWQENSCVQDAGGYQQKLREYMPTLTSVQEKNKNVKLVKISDSLCDKNSCSMAKDGILFYRDNNHLNIDGSVFFGKIILNKYPDMRVVSK